MLLDGLEEEVGRLLERGVDGEVEGLEGGVERGVDGGGGQVVEGEGGVRGGAGGGRGDLVEVRGEEVGVVDLDGVLDEDVLERELGLLEAGEGFLLDIKFLVSPERDGEVRKRGVGKETHFSVVNLPSL